MAVTTTVTSASFTGTGVSSSYAPGFYANSSGQVVVTVDGVVQVLGDDYVVNNVGASTGCDIVGTFTLGSAVYVERVTPITQLVDTQNNETILEDVLDAEFDKLTMIAQEIGGKADRAILVPKGEAGLALAAAASRANRFLSFGPDGSIVLSAGTGTDVGLRADLASSVGSSIVGFIQSGTGAVARTVQDDLRDRVSVKQFGAKGDGSTDDLTAFQTVSASTVSTDIPDGTHIISDTVTFTTPKRFTGNGRRSIIQTTGAFGAKPILTVSPEVGSDPKNWEMGGFTLANAGSATVGIKLDLDASGKYLSKFALKNVISPFAVSTGRFVELSNALPNTDGLFTSLFEDNWSNGGYWLDNVGDSVNLLRNTTFGAGVGYYINQLGTAANISIRDGNCTCSGGALRIVKGANISFDNMQVECPSTFTGYDDALISIHNPTDLVYNTKLRDNNINTQGRVAFCVHLRNADETLIEGNQLRCDPTSRTFSVTVATPGVITVVGHGLVVDQPIHFTTTGALPTGLSTSTVYYVKAVTSPDTFTVSATKGGAEIATSGTQSGSHSFYIGAHICINSGARNTVVGRNKYYSTLTGAEIDPIIVNSGVGTCGVWIPLTITLSGWSAQNVANEHPPAIFMDRDGGLLLRGRVAGAATSAGDTLCTLPPGLRPKVKAYLIGTYGSGASNAVVLQAISTGALQVLTAGATGIYLSGVVFSSK